MENNANRRSFLKNAALGLKPSQLDVNRHFTQTKLTK